MEIIPANTQTFDEWAESVLGQGQKAWQGDTPNGLTVRQIIEIENPGCAVRTHPPTPEQIAEAYKFLNGEMWDSRIRENRVANQRPTLIINMIQRLLTAALVASRDKGEEVPDEDAALAMYILVMRNKDHQRMYNYLFSTYVESVAVFSKPTMIMSTEEAAAMKGVPA